MSGVFSFDLWHQTPKGLNGRLPCTPFFAEWNASASRSSYCLANEIGLRAPSCRDQDCPSILLPDTVRSKPPVFGASTRNRGPVSFALTMLAPALSPSVAVHPLFLQRKVPRTVPVGSTLT